MEAEVRLFFVEISRRMSEKVFSLVLLFLFRSCAHVKKVETFYDSFAGRKQVKQSYHFRSVVI